MEVASVRIDTMAPTDSTQFSAVQSSLPGQYTPAQSLATAVGVPTVLLTAMIALSYPATTASVVLGGVAIVLVGRFRPRISGGTSPDYSDVEADGDSAGDDSARPAPSA